MALKVLENFFSFQTIRRKMKIGERKAMNEIPQDSKKAKSDTITNVTYSSILLNKSFSSLSATSTKGSFSRKRRISTKIKSECEAATEGSEIASPALTHVISKKRSRLTTSTCDLTTVSGDVATKSDEEFNEDADEVKCMPSPGSKCKAYRSSDFDVIGKIGSGGFGIVYLVSFNSQAPKQQQSKTKLLFAMKVIDKRKIRPRKSDWRHLSSEHFVMTHLAEKHPFIVDLFCSFQTRQKLCYVMEFLQGGELYTWLQMKSVFNEGEARFYLSEIYLALEFLHSRSVIFRDLKPENLMLDAVGHIRLIDFGLSTVGLDYDGLSITRTICGTTSYMAPEVISSGKRTGKGYGLAADWWSFGALAFDMMVGAPPFQGANKKKTWDLILNGCLAIPPFFSPQARSLTIGLLERNPSKRLGHPSGGSIRKHQFFDIEPEWWTNILEKRIRPPIVPVFCSPFDLSNFTQSSSKTSSEKDEKKENCKPTAPKPVVQVRSRVRKFENFSFVNDRFHL